MKNLFLKAYLILLSTFILFSCNNDDDNLITENSIPTKQEFNAIKEQALNNSTQFFQFNTADNFSTLTSINGVQIFLSTNCFSYNGIAVTGLIDIEYVEIFDGGNMLTTNKPTMGLMNDGNKSLLISGGEIYLNATLNGQQLEVYTNCITLSIPTSLTNPGGNSAMTLWEGNIDNSGDLTWEELENTTGNEGVFVEGQGNTATYYVFLNTFGWTNVDVFYNDTRPKTTILVDTPEGYDNENSAVYLHYDGQGNSLAKLDTYNISTGLFSEHYGQIPIGLECHIIFVTESDGNWRYAIKPVTISANTTYSFDLSETSVATEAQLITIINALP